MNKKKIIFLGTGAADALKYTKTSFYITENNNTLLVDTGGGDSILTNLERSGIKLEDIKYIFITHKHIDHLFGLFWILRFLGSKIAKGQAESLTIFCSKTIESTIKQISPHFLKPKVTNLFDNKINFTIINNNKKIKIYDWEINCIDTKSTKEEQYGFSLKFANKLKFVTLGDEMYKDELFDQCKNADYFLHEAFCLEADRSRFQPEKIHHSTAKESAINAKKINAKNLIIFHTEDYTFGHRKKLYSQEAKKYFDNKIFVPDELESISLL